MAISRRDLISLESKQAGYMDAQLMPALIGAILLFVIVGQLNNPDFDINEKPYQFISVMAVATLALLYGYIMHCMALGYPESPFNNHTSPVFMACLCAGACMLTSWQFVKVGITWAGIIYAFIALVIMVISIILVMNPRHED